MREIPFAASPHEDDACSPPAPLTGLLSPTPLTFVRGGPSATTMREVPFAASPLEDDAGARDMRSMRAEGAQSEKTALRCVILERSE